MAKCIAIQGYEGCFHQVAAQQFFGNEVQIIPCATFRQLVRTASDREGSDGGIMAIENSIAGSILPNYNLLRESRLRITGEVYLHIRQNLLVRKNTRLEDISEVHSHPMAILQCLEYLEQYEWKLVETEDTALSAKQIQQSGSRHVAAIASTLAAGLYDLEVIAPDIHTLQHNYTRFLVLERMEAAEAVPGADKASLSFQVDHARGTLAKVLNCIADAGVNLSKLQSYPIAGSHWRYNFHADMEFETIEQCHDVIEQLRPLTAEVNVLGIYRKGIM